MRVWNQGLLKCGSGSETLLDYLLKWRPSAILRQLMILWLKYWYSHSKAWFWWRRPRWAGWSSSTVTPGSDRRWSPSGSPPSISRYRTASLAYPKRFFSDLEPTFQVVLDPDSDPFHIRIQLRILFGLSINFFIFFCSFHKIQYFDYMYKQLNQQF